MSSVTGTVVLTKKTDTVMGSSIPYEIISNIEQIDLSDVAASTKTITLSLYNGEEKLEIHGYKIELRCNGSTVSIEDGDVEFLTVEFIYHENELNITPSGLGEYIKQLKSSDYGYDSGDTILIVVFITPELDQEATIIQTIPCKEVLSSSLVTFGGALDEIQDGFIQALDGELQFRNMGFGVYDAENNPVLKASTSGKLSLNNIKCNSGAIGGFQITGNAINSPNGDLSLSWSEETGASLRLQNMILAGGDNSNGIEINNGTNQATISCTETFIAAGTKDQKNLKIYLNGNADFGNIKIDSKNSTIGAQSNGSSYSWRIGPNKAEFSNIVASGKIQTVVFEKAYTQAVGGAMIFKPSYQILRVEGEGTIYVAEEPETKKGNYMWLISKGEYGNEQLLVRVKSVDASNKKLEIESVYSDAIPKQDYSVIIDIGQTKGYYPTEDDGFLKWKTYYELNSKGEYEKTDDSEKVSEKVYYEYESGADVIGINAGNTRIGSNHILGRGLTMTSFIPPDSNGSTPLPAVFLGDLSQLGSEYNGYGLYSNNVHLSGMLTTQGRSGCSGINTNSTIEYKQAPIVFWAGAPNREKLSEAPFFVTSNGLVKMQNAEIVNGLVCNGKIESSKIVAPSFYDTDKGIAFYKTYISDKGEVDTEICKISTNEFSSHSKFSFVLGDKGGDKFVLSQGGLYYRDVDNLSTKTGLWFNKGKIKVEVSNDTLVEFSKDTMNLYKSLCVGGARIEPVEGGYDLFI